VNPVRVDYNNYEMLRERIASAIDSFGNIDTSIHWIHSTAPEAPYVIAEIQNEQNIKSKFFHVLGCEYANPFEKNLNIETTFERFVNIIYKKIILGFVNEDDSSRWLNNYEISNGVIDAVAKDRDASIIGTVEPWSNRPEY
jgi:hypothetical protein